MPANSHQFNPALAIRRRDASGEQWIPIFEALNLRFVAEAAHPRQWADIDTLLERAKLAPMATPIGGERHARELAAEQAEHDARMREWEAQEQELHQARIRSEPVPEAVRAPEPAQVEEAPPAAEPSPRPEPSSAPQTLPWGSREARRAEIERVRRQIEENAARRNSARDG